MLRHSWSFSKRGRFNSEFLYLILIIISYLIPTPGSNGPECLKYKDFLLINMQIFSWVNRYFIFVQNLSLHSFGIVNIHPPIYKSSLRDKSNLTSQQIFFQKGLTNCTKSWRQVPGNRTDGSSFRLWKNLIIMILHIYTMLSLNSLFKKLGYK